MELSRKLRRQEMYCSIDVLSNILNRLPSTSISRFQSVSKYWYHVIHVSVIPNASSKSSLMSVELSTNEDSGKLTFYNFDEEGKTKKKVHKINLVHYKFSNMVNGLVCAYGNKATITFYLINLTTLKTSKFMKRKIGGTALSYDSITLGFDPSTGLYKFIRIYSHSKDRSYYCEILETGVLFEGNWKIIGKIPHDVYLDNPVFSNGAIHWMGKLQSLEKGKPPAFDFLKLDMKEENFEMVAPILNDAFDNCDHTVYKLYGYDFTLTEEKGKLYVVHYCCKRQCLDGWRLNESKEYSAWNVIFRVNFTSMLDREPYRLIGKGYPYIFGIVDGKVLIRNRFYDDGVYIYDLLRKKLSKHCDVHCGSFSFDYEQRRMLFYGLE